MKLCQNLGQTFEDKLFKEKKKKTVKSNVNPQSALTLDFESIHRVY